jgi:hypothetical protein
VTRPPSNPRPPQDLDALDAVALRPLSAAAVQPLPVVTPQSEPVLPSLLDVVREGLTGEVREWVLGELAERGRVGLERYGSPLMTFNERLASVDLEQELLDALQYTQQMVLEARALGHHGRALRLVRLRALLLLALVEVGQDDRLLGGVAEGLGLGSFGVRGDLEGFGRASGGGAP